MSSYFDALSREIAELADQDRGDEEFIFEVIKVEERLYADVTAITGDREFPDDLREKIMGVFAVWGIYQPGKLPISSKAEQFLLFSKCSEAVESIHELFHDLARRRIQTRFGLLSDNPTQIALLREEHDNA